MDEIPPEDFEDFQDVFGRFPSYLKERTDVMLGTAKNYISAIKTYICRENQSTNIHGEWYTDVRNSTEGIFYDECVLSGDAVANQTVPMTADDLRIISEVLFSSGQLVVYSLGLSVFIHGKC